MAAPKGNRFWENRSKHGRDKLFETPDLMWKAATEYFSWCADNPLMEVVIEKKRVNGFGDEIVQEQLPKMRPFTIQGLCLYLDCNVQYFNDFEKAIKGNVDDQSKDFSSVITRIKEIIYLQKFEGAAAGFLNPNIIARDLGLVEKKEIETIDKTFTPEERERKIQELLEKANK